VSPRRLDLYLYCTYRTPVRQNLIYWPLILPLVIHYPGPISHYGPPTGNDDNIVAALMHADRVHRVDIYATFSLIRKVATVMQESFPVLTCLDLTWDQDDLPGPVLPQGFLGGSAPRLEYLYLSGVSSPRLPTILLSASNLLTLHLNDIFQCIPPETMVAGLAVLTRLRTLSIKFNREISRPDQWQSRLDSPMPTILPTLTLFHYKGYSEYLEDLLALIDMPLLDNVRIAYFLADIQVPQLFRFIGRTRNLKDAQFGCAHVTFYYNLVNVALSLPQGESQANITLTLLGPWFHIQVLYLVSVLGQLMAMFSNVGHLSTHGADLDWRDMDDLDSIKWMLFLCLFPAMEELHLSGEVLSYFASALKAISEEMLTEVMPIVTDLQGPPSERTQTEKLQDLKKLAVTLR
jgi:hypothetical protein